MENIGGKIFNLRKEKNVSQEKLAESLKVARFTVSRWETNAVQPTAENIKALSEFFGVEISYFFDNGRETAVSTDDPAGQIPQEIKKSDFRTLKIVWAVAGMVLLALFVIACGIATYVTASPGTGGEWGEDIHIVNYEGIIYFVIGTVSVAVLATLIVISVIKLIKNRKNEKSNESDTRL